MSDPTILILTPGGRRRSGRRPLDEGHPSEPLSTRLPGNHHDRLVRLAAKYDVSVAEMARKILVMQLSRLP